MCLEINPEGGQNPTRTVEVVEKNKKLRMSYVNTQLATLDVEISLIA
jgi:hypothetical protein